MSILMNTETQTFQSILGNGSKYKVPQFQRDYSWAEEQWEDLWADIETLQEEKQHYMGYLVLQTVAEKRAPQLVIDGQQRLTTLSIIVLGAIKHLKELPEDHTSNDKRAEAIRGTYIGSVDPVSLQAYNKIELNRNNDQTFRKLSALEDPQTRKIKKTNKLMKKAFDFFYGRLTGKNGKEIAEFLELIGGGLIFTKISVDNEINAYKVFETLNARGVQLSTPDLLKNYLFSIISKEGKETPEELDHLDEEWESIVHQLGRHEFSYFLRTDWNSLYPTTTRQELFKAIRSKVKTRKDAYDYVKRLGKRAEIYAALFSPHDEFWQREGYRGCVEYLNVFDQFSLRQVFTVLLPAYDKFDARGFRKLLEHMVVLTIRYNVICNRSHKEQERAYNNIAIKISSGDFLRANHIKKSLEFRKIYPSDSDFILSFRIKQMPDQKTTKKIRYLLGKIQSYLQGSDIVGTELTVEHVLPHKPSPEWEEAFGSQLDGVVNRLGNMVLLTSPDNKSANRELFDKKKAIYDASGFYLAKKVAEYQVWDLDMLNDYQHWLADKAAQVWKISYE